jgi:acetyl esterase/lipase
MRREATKGRRGVKRTLFACVLLLAGLVAWTQLSPWPAAMVIRTVFDIGGRKAAEALKKHVPATGIAEMRDVQYDVNDRDALLDLFVPAGKAPPAITIVWIHGGGFVAGSKEDVANYARILASKGYGVASINYTRAPDAHYPVPVEQANRALGWLSTNAPRYGLSRDRIVLAGDSAGAQIAAQLANAIVSPDYARDISLHPAVEPARIVGAVLFCGPYDAALARGKNGKPSWFIRSVMWAYMGRKDFWNDPRVAGFSVARFVTKDFPPAFISVGNGDPLQAHSYFLADALRAQGVRTDTLFWPEDHVPALPHEHQFNLDTAEGREALQRTEEFLASLKPD